MSMSSALAQILMTLSTIAYAEDSAPHLGAKAPDLSIVKASIHHHLKKPHYATKDEWELEWGPIEYQPSRNLAFVAKMKDAPTYAIVLRGTVPSLKSYGEDIPKGQTPFGYGLPKDAMVSTQFMEGFNGLLAAKDPETSTTFADFLTTTALANPDLSMYVTGHSQGAGLSPMMGAWLENQRSNWGDASDAPVITYGFAPPTSGNPEFASWIDKNTQTNLIINPKDLVPHGYAAISQVITDNVPTKVPFVYQEIIKLAAKNAAKAGAWTQPSKAITYTKRMQSSGGYLAQVGEQHNHNSYLLLLGARQTDIGTKSKLTPMPQ